MFMKRIGVLIAAVAALAAGNAVAQEVPNAAAASLKPGAPTRQAAPADPQLGGHSTISYYRVAAPEFQPNFSGISWTREGGNDRIISLDPNPVYFYATAHLPGGALLKSIEFDNCDSNVSGQHMILTLYGCDYHGDCTNLLAFLSSVDNVAGPCGLVFQDLSSAAYTVNNNFAVLSLGVQFQAGNSTNKLSGAIIGYQLQVSPDLGTTTFTDVPVGHPFHQFVEALAQSGVTVGYPDGRFGVDDSMTRGQMAVVLAKALGLNWSQ